MRNFGIYKRLRDIREDKDLFQYDIASYLGVDKTTYSKWETESEVMPLVRAVAFANFMKKSLDYITGLSNDSSDVNYLINIDKKEIGKRLKYIRTKLEYTQEALALVLGCTQSCISEYEYGYKLIPSSYAFEICRLHNISLDWLISGIEKK